jgi:hypothetical protein
MMAIVGIMIVKPVVATNPVPMAGHHKLPYTVYNGPPVRMYQPGQGHNNMGFWDSQGATNYQGCLHPDDTQGGWNIIQFYYNPVWGSLQSGAPYWASDLCNYTIDYYNAVYAGQLVSMVRQFQPDQNNWKTYTPGDYANNFKILGSQSYEVYNNQVWGNHGLIPPISY